MGFSNDEALLNNINLNSVKDYQNFLNELRPILLQESGYSQTESIQNISPNDISGLNTASRKLLESDLSIINGIRSGAEEFTEAAGGRRVVRDGNNIIFYRTDGKHEATLDINDQLQRSYQSVENTLSSSPDKTAFDRETGTLTKTVSSLQKTPERLALEERFKKLEEQQLSLNEAQLERQNKALKGEIPTSETLKKNIQDEFNRFKESQARAGNVILGESLEDAVGKGTAAIESLAAFKNNATQAKERELQSIIQGETPLAYGGFELASGASGSRAYSLPGSVDYGGLQGMSLSGSQPFQFNRQLAQQLELARMGNTKQKSGLGMTIGGLAGAGIGGFFGGPAGAQVGLGAGSMIGSYF